MRPTLGLSHQRGRSARSLHARSSFFFFFFVGPGASWSFQFSARKRGHQSGAPDPAFRAGGRTVSLFCSRDDGGGPSSTPLDVADPGTTLFELFACRSAGRRDVHLAEPPRFVGPARSVCGLRETLPERRTRGLTSRIRELGRRRRAILRGPTPGAPGGRPETTALYPGPFVSLHLSVQEIIDRHAPSETRLR